MRRKQIHRAWSKLFRFVAKLLFSFFVRYRVFFAKSRKLLGSDFRFYAFAKEIKVLFIDKIEILG